MGEARRRQGLAAQLMAVPEGRRREVAADVASVTFFHGAGTCALRNELARQVLERRLGLVVPLVVGGMIYRAGSDPRRDVVPFCGADNRLAHIPGQGIMGHYWLEAGGVVLDFSPPDWRREVGALAVEDEARSGASLGEVRFDAEPPAFVWERRVDPGGVVLPTAEGEPPVGRAYYTAEVPPPAAAREAFAELERAVAALGADLA